MAESVAITIEAEFTASVWSDITVDVLSVFPTIWRRGIWSNKPMARVAGTGSLKLLLDNSAKNSASKLGYYSPEHTDARTGFEIGLAVRVKYVYDSDTYYPWYGRVSVADPTIGQYWDRMVSLVALDYMNILSRYKMAQIPVQADKRPDEVLATIVAALPIAPLTTDYDVDGDIYTRALHTERDGITAGRGAVNKLALSSMAQAFVTGNLTNGETMRWFSRGNRFATTSLTATLDDTMTGLKVIRSSANIYNTVNTTTYQVEVVEGATLYTSRREIVVQPGITTKFTANFTDENGGGRRLTGSENWTTPVKGTHFRASASPDGSGGDLNDNCTVTMGWGANSATVQIDNDAGIMMYVNLFYLVGDALLMYDPSVYTKTDTASQEEHGDRVLSYSMQYQDNPNVGRDFGNFFLDKFKDPVNAIVGVEFIANNSSALMLAAMQGDIGDRIKIIETVTGISTEYFINAVEHKIKSGILRVRWMLDIAGDTDYWILNVSELGLTAKLGP